MPSLPNPRQEAFARARAKGVLLDDAYEMAGFTPGNRHGARLAREPEVADRIAELIATSTDEKPPNIDTVIAAMMRLAEAAPASTNPAAINQALVVLMQARTLIAEGQKAREADRQRFRLGL